MSNKFPAPTYSTHVVFCCGEGKQALGPKEFLSASPQLKGVKIVDEMHHDYLKGITVVVDAYGERHHFFVKRATHIPALLTFLGKKYDDVSVRMSIDYYMEKIANA